MMTNSNTTPTEWYAAQNKDLNELMLELNYAIIDFNARKRFKCNAIARRIYLCTNPKEELELQLSYMKLRDVNSDAMIELIKADIKTLAEDNKINCVAGMVALGDIFLSQTEAYGWLLNYVTC